MKKSNLYWYDCWRSLGGGAVIVGTFAVPVVGPIVGTFLFIGGMVGGAFAGGNAGLKIAEKVNHKEKDQEV